MKLRVAYDVSVPASCFDRRESKSGIYRVIEEVLKELARRDDVEPTLVGLVGGDPFPVATAVRAAAYREFNHGFGSCPYSATFRSRTGLADRYADWLLRKVRNYLDAGRRDAPAPAAAKAASRVALPGRLARKLAHAAIRADARLVLDPRRFDVFHATYRPLPPRRVTGPIPRVITVYDLIPVKAPQFVPAQLTRDFRRILASIDPRRDWAICISDHVRRELCEYIGMHPRRTFVTHLAAAERFRPAGESEVAAARDRYGIPERPYLLSVAAPQPRKNLAHLVRCFFRLLSEGPDPGANLVLVGSPDLGWMHESIFAVLDEAPDLRARVIFPGYVADPDLPAVYSGAAAFVFPSLYEGFGLPPLEAMQCGVPVICSDATSLPEVVGDAGISVPPTDADALVDAMRRVLDDAALRRQLSQKGLERSRRFTWQRCAAETVEAYRRAASG